VVGGQIGANALTANSYPTAIRSTGVGWALGIGRIGSIIGPIIGGLLLSLRWPVRQIFLVAAVPVLIASVAALCISFLRRAPEAEEHALQTGASTP
jgi:AAHS family 4-hydroxybenzoate transporter-like MFS transporter